MQRSLSSNASDEIEPPLTRAYSWGSLVPSMSNGNDGVSTDTLVNMSQENTHHQQEDVEGSFNSNIPSKLVGFPMRRHSSTSSSIDNIANANQNTTN